MPVLTQRAGVPQRVRPGPHVAHTPATHVPPGPQFEMQVPQFVGSVAVSTQRPPHAVWEPGQVQMPATQFVPPAQVVWHVPQFMGSVCASTQRCREWPAASVSVQSAWPVVHTTTHSPIEHISLEPQWFAHVPQCATSVLTSVHTPSHPICGARQSQRPTAQLVPAGHAFPQLPQFIESSEVRVHVPKQSRKPGMQPLFESGPMNASGIATRPSIGAVPESCVIWRATVHAVDVATRATASEADRTWFLMAQVSRRPRGTRR